MSSAFDLEACYRRYGPLVHRRCLRLLRSEAQAEEAMHDVFVELLRRQERIEDRGLSSLLFQIATHVSLNRLRTRRRHPEQRGYSLGAGFGAKVPLPLAGAFIDTDLGFHMLQPAWDFYRGVPNVLYRIRVLARYELHPHLSLFAGLTVNTFVQLDPAERFAPATWFKTHRVTHQGSAIGVRIWPGFIAGVRL
jgi:Sigma-70 region 2